MLAYSTHIHILPFWFWNNYTHKKLQNSTEKFLCILDSVSPNVTSYITLGQYYSQKIAIATICMYSSMLFYPVCICVVMTMIKIQCCSVQFSSVQPLSRVRLFATPWSEARQASLSITISRSSLRLMFIESVMPSSHLNLCRPLFLLPPIPPSIRVFSNTTVQKHQFFSAQPSLQSSSHIHTWPQENHSLD